jgi:hypothetical protein
MSSTTTVAASAARPKKEYWLGEDSDDERERLGADHPDVKKRAEIKQKRFIAFTFDAKKLEEAESQRLKERKRYLVQKELEKAGHVHDPTQTYDEYGRPRFSLVSASDQSEEAKQNAKLLASNDPYLATERAKLRQKFQKERDLHDRLAEIVYGKLSNNEEEQKSKHDHPDWELPVNKKGTENVLELADAKKKKSASASSKLSKKRKADVDPDESGEEEKEKGEAQSKPKKAKSAKPATDKKPKSEKKEKKPKEKKEKEEDGEVEEKPAKKPRVKHIPNAAALKVLAAFEKACFAAKDMIPLFVDTEHKKAANKFLAENGALIFLLTNTNPDQAFTPHEILMLARQCITKLNNMPTSKESKCRQTV